MTSFSSQELESYVPVYDAIPEKWEDARGFLAEDLKKMSNAINIREIGWFLDEELLSGKSFIPGTTAPGDNPGTFRQIFRKVINFGAIAPGANTEPHGITFDINFTLIQLWASATNSTTFNAVTFSNPDTITMNATNIIITSGGTFNRAFAFVEYLLEV
jgi:hypothetical protein